jgi:hypothetical protein
VSRATKGLSTGKTARFAGFALPLSFTKTHRESRAWRKREGRVDIDSRLIPEFVGVASPARLHSNEQPERTESEPRVRDFISRRDQTHSEKEQRLTTR